MNNLLLRFAIIMMAAMSIFLVGCDVLYRSRIDIMSTCKRVPTEVTVLAVVETAENGVVRSLLKEKGYAIRDQVTNDPFVNQELQGESFDVVWRADKPYNPTVIYARSNERATVKLSKLSGPIRPLHLYNLENEIYSVLAKSCGQENVHLTK